jgi:hypothetical protein
VVSFFEMGVMNSLFAPLSGSAGSQEKEPPDGLF